MIKKAERKIKTEWDLSLIYKSIKDPAMETDLSIAEKTYAIFVSKYTKDDSYLKNETALYGALEELEKLSTLKEGNSYSYLKMLKDLDSKRTDLDPKINLILQRLQKLGNSLLFFEINLSKIQPTTKEKFLKSPKLKKYNYYLKKLFENSKYILSEKEEKIINLMYLPSHKMWTDFVSDLSSKSTVKHKGKVIPVSKATNLVHDLKSQKEREILYKKIMQKSVEISHTAEKELNAIVQAKKIEDDLRGHLEPFDATILSYENDKETVSNLVKTVTDSFGVVHKFYKIKAKMLGVKKLKYSDRFANVGKTSKKIPFETALDTLQNLFSNLDPQFGEILQSFIEKGQIDVYPKLGKRGGAYCSGGYARPTYVLLNHIDNFDSMSTFAHEMGHSIHTELSKVQTPTYHGYSTSTAEVASTLFENFLFHSEFEKLSDKEKIIALHDKISDAIGTIYSQIMLFNFEVEMHKTIREKGSMTKEELASCMLKHLKACYGPNFEYEDINGYAFVTWPHIRFFFYVYSYAFGLLTSNALYQKYSEDKSYIKQIKQFMNLGSSMSPEDIFASIGVDLRKPDFFKKGIESIKSEVDLLEKLVNKK